LKPGRPGKGAHRGAAMAAATQISVEEVARAIRGRHGGARWGSGGRVARARARSEEGLHALNCVVVAP
jgi:hypothetical protein